MNFEFLPLLVLGGGHFWRVTQAPILTLSQSHSEEKESGRGRCQSDCVGHMYRPWDRWSRPPDGPPRVGGSGGVDTLLSDAADPPRTMVRVVRTITWLAVRTAIFKSGSRLWEKRQKIHINKEVKGY